MSHRKHETISEGQNKSLKLRCCFPKTSSVFCVFQAFAWQWLLVHKNGMKQGCQLPPRSLWQPPLVWITEHDNIVRWESGKVTAHYSGCLWLASDLFKRCSEITIWNQFFFLLFCQTSFSKTNTIYCVNSKWLNVKRIQGPYLIEEVPSIPGRQC